MNHNQRLRLRFSFFFTADKGGGSGGSTEKPKSLEDKLSEAEGARDKALTDLGTITTERDGLKTENGRIQGQFDELVKTNDAQKKELTEAKDQVVKLTSDRDALSGKLVTADKNVERLESLCRVRGVDTNAAPPQIENKTADQTREGLIEQLDKATDPAERGRIGNQLRALSLKKV